MQQLLIKAPEEVHPDLHFDHEMEKVSVWERGRKCTWEVQHGRIRESYREAVRTGQRERNSILHHWAWDGLFEVLQFGMREDESDAGFAYAQMIGPNAYSDIKTAKQRDVWGEKAMQNYNLSLNSLLLHEWTCKRSSEDVCVCTDVLGFMNV